MKQLNSINYIIYPEQSKTLHTDTDALINNALGDYLKTIGLSIYTDYTEDFIEKMKFSVKIKDNKISVEITDTGDVFELYMKDKDTLSRMKYVYLSCLDKDLNTVFSKTSNIIHY